MKPAKSHIVRALLAFSCLVSFQASGDDSSDIAGIKGTLEILNEWITADQYQFFQDWKQDELTALQQIVPIQFQNRVLQSLVGRGVNDSFSYSDTDNIRAYLQAITRGVYGTSSHTSSPLSGSLLDYQKKQLSRLTEALYLLEALTNSSSSASISPDILAGNPWWATNSAFALTQRDYSRVYPNEYPNNAGTFSFPQFLSQWSGFLTYPSSSSGNTINLASLRNGWHNYFGLPSRSWDANSAKPYTWFDFMADAMRSNWVAQASEQSTLESILAASLASGGSTNIVNVLVTNIVGGVTNILNAQDILAGNPWWATNSGFQVEWTGYNTYHPYPTSGYQYSFPELASIQSATRTRVLQLSPDLYNAFGLSRPFLSGYGVNPDNGLYTFEDWIADFLKSNLVLTTSVHPTNIEDELYQAGYDTSVSISNTPLPQYEFPVEDVSSLESIVESGQSSVNSFLDSIQKPGTGGDSEIVLIPEFTVGGIHVDEYRADLDSPIVPYCRSVLIFLYYVGVGVFLFQLAKSEYVYYASLGREWGKY